MDVSNKRSTEEILKKFRDCPDNKTMRVFTKTGFIIKAGGLLHKMQDGVLYVGTRDDWRSVDGN